MKATIENIKIAEKDRSYNSYILKQKKSDYRQTVFTDYWHYHPEIEITYIIKGNGLAFIGNKTIEFGPGQAFLLGPYLPHNFIGTDEEGIVLERECWGLQFTTEWLYSIKESAALQRLFNAMSFGINLGQLRALEHQAFSVTIR